MFLVHTDHCGVCGRSFSWCDEAEHFACAECGAITCCDDSIECGGNYGDCKRSICRNCWNKHTSKRQDCPACGNSLGYSKSKHELYHR